MLDLAPRFGWHKRRVYDGHYAIIDRLGDDAIFVDRFGLAEYIFEVVSRFLFLGLAIGLELFGLAVDLLVVGGGFLFLIGRVVILHQCAVTLWPTGENPRLVRFFVDFIQMLF